MCSCAGNARKGRSPRAITSDTNGGMKPRARCMVGTMNALLSFVFTLLGLPVVCANWDYSHVWISEAACSFTQHTLCEPGFFVQGSGMQVCCDIGEEDGCRLIDGSSTGCKAVEWNVCDMPTASDSIACLLNNNAVYIGAPICKPGDAFECQEGTFDGPNSVCCENGSCKLREICRPIESQLCSGWGGIAIADRVCMSPDSISGFVTSTAVCPPNTWEVCESGQYPNGPDSTVCCNDQGTACELLEGGTPCNGSWHVCDT